MGSREGEDFTEGPLTPRVKPTASLNRNREICSLYLLWLVYYSFLREQGAEIPRYPQVFS